MLSSVDSLMLSSVDSLMLSSVDSLMLSSVEKHQLFFGGIGYIKYLPVLYNSMSASISDLDLNVIDNMSQDGFYVFTLFGLTLASISYMAKQFELKMNWSSVKYRPEVMKYSWLWSNVENSMKGGIIDSEDKITQQLVMNPVVKSLDDATNKMNNALSAVSKDVGELKKKVDEANTFKNNKTTTLAIALQNNILALKEGMQKVIASLIIQRHMHNGTIKMMSGTRSLQESVRTAVNKVSGQAPLVTPPAVEEPKLLPAATVSLPVAPPPPPPPPPPPKPAAKKKKPWWKL